MKLHLKLARFFISAISAVAVLTFASCASTKSAKSQNAIAVARVELVETEPANSSATDEIFNSVLRLDTHLHVDVPMEDSELPWSEKVDLKSAMEKAGYNAVVMIFAVDYVTLKYPGHAYKRFLNALDAQKKILDDSGLSLTLTFGQLEENFKNGEAIVISHTGLNTRLGNNEKMAQMFYPRLISESLAKDVAAKGEKMNFPKQDLNAKNHVRNGEDENFYCSTIRELAKLGYSKDEIEKIAGGNFARVFKEATE